MTSRTYTLIHPDGSKELIGSLEYPEMGIFATRDLNGDFFADFAFWCPGTQRVWLVSDGNAPPERQRPHRFIRNRYSPEAFDDWVKAASPFSRFNNGFNSYAGSPAGSVLWTSAFSDYIGHGLWTILVNRLTPELRRKEIDAWVRADLIINPEKPIT